MLIWRMVRWLRHVLPFVAILIVSARQPAIAQEESASTKKADKPTVEISLSEASGKVVQPAPAANPPETVSNRSEAASQPTPGAIGPPPESLTPSASPAASSGSAASPAVGQEPAAGKSGQQIQPIPDPQPSEPPKIETASFKGITPGVTILKDLQDAWGPPRQISKQDGLLVHLYTVEPFDKVEVGFSQDTVASIVIRLSRAVHVSALTKQLKLAIIRPVLVSNELGKILGQSFPERGVLFAFEPSDTPGELTMNVVQIIIEPISSESFVLRAETYLDSHPEASAADLENAIRLKPTNARASWLHARVLAGMGDLDKALRASDGAVRLEPNNPQYQVARAQILGQMARFAEGIEQAKAALPNAEKRPHVKARALCLLGDLASSGPKPDYHQAIEYHTQAIKTADPLAIDPHPAIRLAAKEVLIDAHLGAAHDIAWGNWNEKQTAVRRWLQRAATFAEELIENDGGTTEHRFRVAVRALAAYVGAEGQLDPAQWTQETLRIGQELLDAAEDPARKQLLQWDLGLALYDAVQIYQMRSEHDAALRYGEQAIAYLEQGLGGKRHLADAYLLGRLYFRLGAIHAVGKQNHKTAVAWFEKAIPLFEKSIPRIGPYEAGRLGETFVSMGVSYWDAGERDRAVQLTQRGVSLIELAVKDGTLDRSSLEVPYSNLATMHRQLGHHQEADQFLEQAIRNKTTSQR